jgi:hypothetical protein
LDSLRDFFHITSRTAHPEEAFQQFTERTFGTAMPYLPISVAGLEPDRRHQGLWMNLRKSKETGSSTRFEKQM